MKNQNINRLMIGIVCVVLTMAITLQIRTMSKTDSTVTQSFANDELKDKLLEWEERYNIATANSQICILSFL